jgi:hypothetical protein
MASKPFSYGTKSAKKTFTYELDLDTDAIESFAAELYSLADPHSQKEMNSPLSWNRSVKRRLSVWN